ncbi:hypothetical protein C0J52_17208 [Blattella germanica]|nr:hypothetical protein C0J52_17208 [Blattella germanica]
MGRLVTGANASARFPGDSRRLSPSSMDEEEIGAIIELHVYDLTRGAAQVMSQLLIGNVLVIFRNLLLALSSRRF